MRRGLRRAFLAAGGLAGALGAGEIAVRLAGDPRAVLREEVRRLSPVYGRLLEGGLLRRHPDPERRFALSPGYEGEADGKRYRVNALGLRGAEVSREKPRGITRALLLGDSFVFGLGVGEGETIAVRLEEELRARRPGLEVLNLGVPGYHTGQEVAFLRSEGLSLAPDAVVLVFYTNDITTEGFHYDDRTRCLYNDLLPLPYAWKGRLIRSALYASLVRARADALRERLQAGGDRDWPVTRERLDAWWTTLRDAGIPGLLVNLPFLTWTSDLRNPEWEWHRPYRKLEAWAEERGVPCLGLLEALAADYVEKLYVRADVRQPDRVDNHFNAEGCARLAREIARALEPLLP
ncbi:MAG TPA: GDSL-type esterase/lipase family protein [Planctomycetota bacterium]|nr:GDSL-type esterase/lipase family protein [Planctomycetota bacterium]